MPPGQPGRSFPEAQEAAAHPGQALGTAPHLPHLQEAASPAGSRWAPSRLLHLCVCRPRSSALSAKPQPQRPSPEVLCKDPSCQWGGACPLSEGIIVPAPPNPKTLSTGRAVG